MESTQAKTRSSESKRSWLIVVLALMSVLVLFLLNDRRHWSKRDTHSAVGGFATGSELLREISAVSRSLSQHVGESVVRVEVRRDASPKDEELQRMFGSQTLPPTGQGSGIVVSDDGLVLTNYHVIAGARSITISSSGQQCVGSVVGSDVLTDLALIRASEKLGQPVPWGDSDQLAVGDFVWAIGNPFGLQRSVTFGIVSAIEQKGISENQFQNFFQTDAAVNPGNSGGPVVDGNGKVVGINTAIAGEAYRGISFAIPSNTAREVVQQLKISGRVRRGWLGVNLADVTERKALELALPSTSGALVDSFSKSPDASPAKAAGIHIDDVIVDWNATSVISAVQLGRLIAQTDLGTTAKVRLWRQGRLIEAEVTIAERP